MVTATSNSTTQFVISRATFLVAPTGEAPTTAVGYKSGPVQIKVDKKLITFPVEDLDGPAVAITDTLAGSIKAKVVQINPATMSLALGQAENGNEILIGGVPVAVLEYAVKVIGTRRDGKTITVLGYKCVPDGGLNLDFDKKKMTELDLSFVLLDSDTGMAKVLVDQANITATVASGVLTRTAAAGYHQVLGEGSVADVVGSITGASLTDGETLRLQISAITSPITFTHLADTLELTGSVDWTMTKLNDYIDLQYNATGTKWVEIGRYDAIA